MRSRAPRIPRLLMVLVFAFAPYEPRPLLAVAELFRGLAIQLTYRWGVGRVMADPCERAVLLWSDCAPTTRRSAGRELRGGLAAVAVGLVLFVVSNALLITVVAAVMGALGAPPMTVSQVAAGIVALRLSLTLWRACLAYRHCAGLAAQLPDRTGTRWRIDYLAAHPPRSGHGGRLLDEFLSRADRDDAEVVLHCDSRNLAFYGRHGFRVVSDRNAGGQVLLVRAGASTRRSLGSVALRASLQGHQRREVKRKS